MQVARHGWLELWKVCQKQRLGVPFAPPRDVFTQLFRTESTSQKDLLRTGLQPGSCIPVWPSS